MDRNDLVGVIIDQQIKLTEEKPEKIEEPENLDTSEDEELRRAVRKIMVSPTRFARIVLNIKPYPYQQKFLEDPSKRIIVCAGRQVGKSLMMAVRSLWFAVTHPDTVSLIISHTHRQSLVTFDKILRFIELSDVLRDTVVRKTRTIIQFSNQSQIVALPCGRSGDSLRAYTAHFVFIDEAAFVPEEVITTVAMPMLVTTKGTLVMVSTPYDKDHYFYRALHMDEWSKYHFKTSDNPVVSEGELNEARESLSESKFRQEYLAEFVDDDNTYFPMVLLRRSLHVCDGSGQCQYCDHVAGRIDPVGDLFAGYDPGGMSDPAALVVIQRFVEEKPEKKITFRVVLTRKFLKESKITGNNSAALEQSGNVYTRFTVQISDLHKKLHFKKLVIDSTGVGNPIVEHCKELGLPVGRYNYSSTSKEELLSNLKILFEKGRVILPDSLELLSSLNCIEAERTRTGGYTFSHTRGSHDDLGNALALAVWAARSSPVIYMNKS